MKPNMNKSLYLFAHGEYQRFFIVRVSDSERLSYSHKFFDSMKKILPAILIALAAVSCKEAIPQFEQTVRAPLGDIRALYIGLGHNMWCDWPTPMMGATPEEGVQLIPEKRRPDLELRCRDEYWKEVTDYAASRGLNMLVVDLGEGLFYPSHPELAIEGTWSVEKMQSEIRRLNALGFEVVPKLNFSNTHNGWMKGYRHMVSSPEYYKMCSDVIADAYEIFGHPRFFHIAYDEENQRIQRHSYYRCERREEFWWNDFLYIISCVESHDGCRPWVWSDYGWYHEDYAERCPKSVVQQNWFYDEELGGFDIEKNETSDKNILKLFFSLKEKGFDQVPCSTIWRSAKHVENDLSADYLMKGLVQMCRKDINDEHLWGFMMAPWSNCATERGRDNQKHGIDVFVEALER